jgi:hypothetical protein
MDLMDQHPQLRSLVERGRARGSLGAADLREVLPIESLSVEQLAEIISFLQDAGVEVDVDPGLLGPVRAGARQPIPDVTREGPKPSVNRVTGLGTTDVRADSLAQSKRSSNEPLPRPVRSARANWSILLAGILTVGLLIVAASLMIKG